MREDDPPRNCDSQGCHLRTRVWIDVSPSHCTPIYTWENHAPDQSLLMYDSPLCRKCNLVLWWYQMYLIAENPKRMFWITVYHVPNLDPRSWIRPASAEFCFFWCPSHSALIHKVQQKSYHHKSINRKSYPMEKFTGTDLDFIYTDLQGQLFPPQTRHGLEASSTPTPPCDKCGWCWLGALPRQWLWRTVETILYLDAGGRNWGWLKQLTSAYIYKMQTHCTL